MKNMENKYYTPTIEEFHVGFEYEARILNVPREDILRVAKHDMKMSSDTAIQIAAKELGILEYVWEQNKWDDETKYGYFDFTKLRVKRLNKEDIESLGFKEYVHSYGIDFRNKTHKIAWWWDNKGIDIRVITESGIGEKCIFSGIIKNKSELKRILKQLNIL